MKLFITFLSIVTIIIGFAIYKKVNRVYTYNNEIPYERTFKSNGHTYKEFYYKPSITKEPISIIHDPDCECLNK